MTPEGTSAVVVFFMTVPNTPSKMVLPSEPRRSTLNATVTVQGAENRAGVSCLLNYSARKLLHRQLTVGDVKQTCVPIVYIKYSIKLENPRTLWFFQL